MTLKKTWNQGPCLPWNHGWDTSEARGAEVCDARFGGRIRWIVSNLEAKHQIKNSCPVKHGGGDKVPFVPHPQNMGGGKGPPVPHPNKAHAWNKIIVEASIRENPLLPLTVFEWQQPRKSFIIKVTNVRKEVMWNNKWILSIAVLWRTK